MLTTDQLFDRGNTIIGSLPCGVFALLTYYFIEGQYNQFDNLLKEYNITDKTDIKAVRYFITA